METRRRADPTVLVADGADEQIVFEFLGEDHLGAASAFDPEIVRRVSLGNEGNRVADAGQPIHATFSLDAASIARLRLAT